jgi:hypothetical protein
MLLPFCQRVRTYYSRISSSPWKGVPTRLAIMLSNWTFLRIAYAATGIYCIWYWNGTWFWCAAIYGSVDDVASIRCPTCQPPGPCSSSRLQHPAAPLFTARSHPPVPSRREIHTRIKSYQNKHSVYLIIGGQGLSAKHDQTGIKHRPDKAPTMAYCYQHMHDEVNPQPVACRHTAIFMLSCRLNTQTTPRRTTQFRQPSKRYLCNTDHINPRGKSPLHSTILPHCTITAPQQSTLRGIMSRLFLVTTSSGIFSVLRHNLLQNMRALRLNLGDSRAS